MPRSAHIPALALFAVVALCSCEVGPNYKRPVMETPARYKNAVAGTSTATPPDRWWSLFRDPMLDQLIEQVDVSNQNLAEAVAAYDQAVAAVRLARSSFFPSISTSASVERVKSGAGSSPISSLGVPGSNSSARSGASSGTEQINQVSGTATWELDVWGQLRRTLENAQETARADLADLAYARLSAQNQLATAYLQLRGEDAEIELLGASVTAYQRTLVITQNRYKAGTVPKTDVLQAESSVFAARQQQAAARLARVQLEDAIAALVGKPASDFHIAARNGWNTTIPDIPTGIPSALLRRRPDVMAAEHNVAAANANVGVQEANYFPQLTLTGTYGFLSTDFGTLFHAVNATRDAVLSASDTVFNFGGTQAKVAEARAAYRQEVATYFQTILTAFQDVENDLASVDWDKQQYGILKSASDAADENERLTLNEYKAGTVDFTTVVVAQTAALTARVSLVQMEISEQTAAVSLITDLGGGWTLAASAKP
ncbi:MAG TPA: efflux transporter outer membrane subunit [Steroidobacteraceae bacterium]|nr:efflux transporter outer membrane subunit [Steroidobacteraceae bacterium]